MDFEALLNFNLQFFSIILILIQIIFHLLHTNILNFSILDSGTWKQLSISNFFSSQPSSPICIVFVTCFIDLSCMKTVNFVVISRNDNSQV